MSKLDLDIVRLQGQAYQLLEDVMVPIEQVEGCAENLARIIAIALNIATKEWRLTDDQAMALLILTILKATEVVDE